MIDGLRVSQNTSKLPYVRNRTTDLRFTFFLV